MTKITLVFIRVDPQKVWVETMKYTENSAHLGAGRNLNAGRK